MKFNKQIKFENQNISKTEKYAEGNDYYLH